VTKVRKAPLRTCVACRNTSDKRGFVRIVRTPDGHVQVDPTGKANGRGAYLCDTIECFDVARIRRRLDSALKTQLQDDDYHRLRREFEDALAAHSRSQQGR
jgi:hypothetical protein